MNDDARAMLDTAISENAFQRAVIELAQRCGYLEKARTYAESGTIGASKYRCPGGAPTPRGVSRKELTPVNPQYTPSQITRFWSKVERSGDCWIWIGGSDSHGYGKFVVGHQRWVRAHRAAWIIATGKPIPDGLEVLHICDMPGCVRNDEPGTYEIEGVLLPRYGHLALGTHAENVADMRTKGRGIVVPPPRELTSGDNHWTRKFPERRLRGESHPMAKLTDDQVAELRARYAVGDISQRALARFYGISVQQINRILRGLRR